MQVWLYTTIIISGDGVEGLQSMKPLRYVNASFSL